MNIIGQMRIWFIVSFVTLVIGVAAIGVYRLKPAIDFTGGSLLELSVPQELNRDETKAILEKNGFENVIVTPAGQGSLLIRSKPVDQEKKNKALKALQDRMGDKKITEQRFTTIGPTVSNDLLKKSIISVVLASLAIIGYIAFAFRKMADKRLSWRFGLTAVGALLHDLLFTIGIFALASHFFHWEVDSLFITALLTVMGFSVHDTIVVFDRIRENLRRYPDVTFDEVVNASVVQTMARSLNTSLTILVTLAALLLLGGTTLQPFIFTLFIGIFVGTYSSIFIASPLLVVWRRYLAKKSIAK